jgi:hypothetical protein
MYKNNTRSQTVKNKIGFIRLKKPREFLNFLFWVNKTPFYKLVGAKNMHFLMLLKRF